MHEFTLRNAKNLAKSYGAPRVIIFDECPKAPPIIMYYDHFIPESPDNVIVVYTRKRADHYLNMVDRRIGTYTIPKQVRCQCGALIQCPCKNLTIDGKPQIETHNIFGRLLFYIHCGYRINAAEPAKSHLWFKWMEMHQNINKNYHVWEIFPEEPIQNIQFFFELTVVAEADYHDAEFESSCSTYPPKDATINQWYVNKTRPHKLTAFDNPFGPYSNYTVTL